mmetsp:Transcript_100708/g.123320  ORF Transcript_100708/g.123320 Transcript_100708/m.123320 type:complete len:265 (-) Transcript_100708:11-805(-)
MSKIIFKRKNEDRIGDKTHKIGMKQALPIDDDVEVDYTRPPLTAQEYLKRVRIEASKLPDSVNIDINTIDDRINKKKSKNINKYSNIFDGLKVDKNEYKLNNDWKVNFVKSFKRNHEYLSNLNWTENQNEIYYSSMILDKYTNICVPHFNRKDNWIEFVTKMKIPPFFNIVKQISPVGTQRILENLMNYVMNNDLNIHVGIWIYALFLRINIPLSYDITANIRHFARYCLKLRNNMDNIMDDIIGYVLTNMFITVVEDVFKQPL